MVVRTGQTSQAQMSSRVNLVGIPQLILRNRLAGAGFTARDCRQVTKYIHKHGGKDLGSVPELSKAKRAELASNYQVNYGKIVSTQESEDDGVCKWLVELNHGETVETVFIPETSTAGVRRGVLCVSSQVGCSLACTFCHTGTQRLKRNLTHSEIVSQVRHC